LLLFCLQAFDAGRHPGAFVAQATVDVASMLQAGSLSASAPLVNSTGGLVQPPVPRPYSCARDGNQPSLPSLTLGFNYLHGHSSNSSSNSSSTTLPLSFLLHYNPYAVHPAGTTIGHVLFDVELSTSSRAIAASLDIPGLTIIAPQRARASSSRQMQPAAGSRPADHLQEEHLSGSFTSFTIPSMQQRQQMLNQQQQMQQQHAAGSGAAYGGAAGGAPCEQQPDGTRRLSQRIAKGAHELGSMLGLSMKRRNNEEPPAAAAPRPISPFAAVAGDAASAAAAGFAADAQASFDSLPESAGPLPCSLMAKRNSYLNSSNSFSSATAPPLPPSFTAAHAAAAAAAGGAGVHLSLAAAGAAGMGVTDSVQLLAAGGRLLHQRSRYSSRTSDSSSVQYAGSEAAGAGRIPGGLRVSRSMSSSSAAAEHHHQQQQHAVGLLHARGRPGTAGEVLSPLRSSRRQLKLSPSKMVQHAAIRHQQLLQARQQEERLLQQAADALQQLQGDAAAVDRSGWDDEVAREYDAADAAEKEAILYRQLVLQQAEKQAGEAGSCELLLQML
jgi:hypothetical protein